MKKSLEITYKSKYLIIFLNILINFKPEGLNEGLCHSNEPWSFLLN